MVRRAFGSVRQLRSGRWQARYRAPDGLMRTGPRTYRFKRDAELFLARTEADISRDDWYDPWAGAVTVAEFGQRWLAERHLAATTRERYEIAFRIQIVPTFGKVPISAVRDPDVRRWRADLLESGAGHAAVAKAYRLLRAIFNTAVDDGLIRRNPCRVRGAGEDQSPERPTLTIEDVLKVAHVIPERYGLLVLLATFTSLRFGELAALRRSDIDLVSGFVSVRRSQVELSNGGLLVKDPKSRAGRRRVAIPRAIRSDVQTHLDRFAQPGAEGLVFVGDRDGRLRRQNFRSVWIKAQIDAGVTPVHFHDLRHSGNMMAAVEGATLRELMDRMGHTSPRAAMIYQHAVQDRDQRIANAISEQIEAARTLRET
jgi:integrase